MTDITNLKSDAIARCIEQYERKRGADFPDLRPFVADVDSLWRRDALGELAAADLQARFRAGRTIRCEDYLRKYSELGPIDAFPIELVAVEFSMRAQAGERVEIAEFDERFPAQTNRLRERLQRTLLDTKPLANADNAAVTSLPSAGLETRTEPLAEATSGRFPILTGDRVVPAKLGRYEIIRQLGAGGMGAVYLAQDPDLKRRVALKIPSIDASFDASFIERFRREAQAAANLNHANICTVYDVGSIDGFHYLCMPFVEGRSLHDVIDGQPMRNQRQIAAIAQKSALALHEAHEHKIIHRDVKPANIMIDKRGEPILMDFGIARVYGDNDLRLTQGRTVIGTPAYMSPEQAVGAELTPAADVYSLGVVIYQMLTGRLPFEATIVSELVTRILIQPPEPPSDVADGIDPKLEAICMKAMAKKLEDRYTTAQQLADALGDYLGTTPLAASAGSANASVGRWIIGGVALTLIVASAAFFGRGGIPTGPAPAVAKEAPPSELKVVASVAPEAKQSTSPASPAATPTATSPAVASAATVVSPAPSSTPGIVPPKQIAEPLAAPFDEKQAKNARADWARQLGQPEEYVSKTIGAKLTLIPPGEFMMGSPTEDVHAERDENPQHRVRIAQPFYLATTEVTKGQFRKFVESTKYLTDAERGVEVKDGDTKMTKGAFGYNELTGEAEVIESFHWKQASFPQDDDHPVMNVSWNDAKAFCAWLSKEDGREYRLPSEAEWEYAGRAGVTTPYQSSDAGFEQVANILDAAAKRMNSELTEAHAGDDGVAFTAPVGRYRANPFGLYDMHGNVWEWCGDWYDRKFYAHSPADDPKGPSTGSERVMRGGGWSDSMVESRSATRDGEDPAFRADYIGFRLALNLAK